jgi:hypothetical protein
MSFVFSIIRYDSFDLALQKSKWRKYKEITLTMLVFGILKDDFSLHSIKTPFSKKYFLSKQCLL